MSTESTPSTQPVVDQQTPEVNPFAIFSTNIEDIKSFEEASGTDWGSIFYEPSPEEGKAYIALIKFLPNIYNALNPLVFKAFYKLINPDNAKPLYFDSPSSIGEDCPAINEWSRLFNSEDARDKELAKKYKRTRQKCGVIQILKDPQQPDLDGQLRLFRMQFEGDIDNSIKGKLKPSKEEIELDPTLKPVDVFNPFSSPAMKLKVVLNSNGRDFAGSVWTDTNTGMFIDGKAITAADATNEEVQKKIVELLKQDHVNITEHFQYKAADPSRLALVKRAIQKMSNAPVDVAPAADTQPAAATNAASTEATNGAAATTAAAPAAETAPVEKTVVAPVSDAQKADVFDELGIN